MLQLKNIYKTYRSKNGVTHRALNNVNLSFPSKGLVFIVGKSGGGKTTLLNVIGALDNFDKGEIIFKGKSFSGFKQKDYDAYRNTKIGVVFQDLNLIQTLKIEENIAYSLSLQGKKDKQAVYSAMEKVGISELSGRYPKSVSGGQAQRVAIARAIVKNPDILLADEPTGSLDSTTGDEIMELLKIISRNKLVIVVTHDREKADEIGDRIIEIQDGRVHKDLIRTDEYVDSAVDIVGNTLLRIPKNEKLDEYNVEKFNELMKENLRDNYIVSEKDTLKVKSLNIHIKNAVVINNKEQVTNFMPYKHKDEIYTESEKYINAKLPLKESFKLSLSNLRKKVGILILIVFVLVLSLMTMGITVSFSRFNYDSAMTSTLTNDNVETIFLLKNKEYAKYNYFSNNDIENIKTQAGKNASAVFIKKIELQNYLVDKSSNTNNNGAENEIGNIPDIYFSDGKLYNDISGIAEIDDVSKLGFTMLYGSSSTENGIIVTDFFLNELNEELDSSLKKNNIQDFLNTNLDFCDKSFEIVGIIKLKDIEKYQNLKDSKYNETNLFGNSKGFLQEQYKNDYYLRLGLIYAKNNFYNENIASFIADKKLTLASHSSKELNFGTTYINKYSEIDSNELYKIYDNDSEGIVITLSLFNSLFSEEIKEFNIESQTKIKEKIDQFNLGLNRKYYISNKELTHAQNYLFVAGYMHTLNEVKIIGVENNDYNMIYMEDSLLNSLDTSTYNDGVLINLADNKNDNMKILKYAQENEYSIASYFTPVYSFSKLLTETLNRIIKNITLISIIIVVILLTIFIRSGIKNNKKQMGIVRAMGARRIDILKIYTLEGFLITTFSLLLSILLFGLAVIIINNTMASNYMFNYTYVIFSPYSILVMIGSSVLITVIALSLTLIRFLKLTPTGIITK